jgi:hypothetical protein
MCNKKKLLMKVTDYFKNAIQNVAVLAHSYKMNYQPNLRVHKQLICFQNYYSILSRLCQGKGPQNVFSFQIYPLAK